MRKQQIQQQSLMIDSQLMDILKTLVTQHASQIREYAVIHFKDPGYSAEKGGFHPVEIAINQHWQLRYVGQAPFIELVKNLDFDFEYQRFQQFSTEFPLTAGRELFAMWQQNFLAYYNMQVYHVAVEVY